MLVQIRNNLLDVIFVQDLSKGKILVYYLICLFKKGKSYTYFNYIQQSN